MMILFIAWLLGGTLCWIQYHIENGFHLGILGDLLVGLPICLIFGPIWIIRNFVNNLLD